MALNLSGIIAVDKGNFAQGAEFFWQAARLKPAEAGFWKNTAITARLAGNSKLERAAAQKYQNLVKKLAKYLPH